MSAAWLLHPVPGWPISQRYGEHPEAYAKFGLPGHEGIDWACPVGTPIRAAAAGTIATLQPHRKATHPYGIHVRVRHFHKGEEWITVYAHLDRIADGLAVGSHVEAGQVIGLSGNTGHSTGPHCHFSVRRGGAIVNPEPWLLPEDAP